MTGREVYGQSHKHTRKPAPYVYLFDFASSVHRSLRVRATVFSFWPQTPQKPFACCPPSHLFPFENINSGKRSCLFAFFPPLPLKWCMEVTHRHGREKKEGRRTVEESFVCKPSGATLKKILAHEPSLPKQTKKKTQPKTN